jgi:cation-transporting P-type ATPase E
MEGKVMPDLDPSLQNHILTGLSETEAIARRKQGLGNQASFQTSRSYLEILRENVFTFINIVLFGLGFVLILLGRASDALVSVGVILVNVIVNVVQEVRAKRTLDRIALITRPTAMLLRDGALKKVDPAEIVVGDILQVRPGDQIVVDGPVTGPGAIEVDESLLTGESRPVLKRSGEMLLSGSFCVTGAAYYSAEKVGAQSLSSRMTLSARAFRRVQTPLQQQVNLVVRVLLLVAVYFEVLRLATAITEQLPLVVTIQSAVVILGLVPNGLFLAIATAYSLGAVRIARKGALVQQANAIESLSNVNMICLDKTGTLTTNRIFFHGLKTFDIAETGLRQRLGNFTANITAGNPTSAAIAAELPGQLCQVAEEIPFSSEYKWSGLAFKDPAMQGVYILGALEILQSSLRPEVDLEASTQAWTGEGLRVVAFAYTPHLAPLRDATGKPCLPSELSLLGLVSLGDELRPAARRTLEAFQALGVKLKIISGDNPATVAAVARQAGFETTTPPVSGIDLAQMEDTLFEKTVAENAIFGRITPQQKEQMVKILRKQGHYVAMVGDGVNDVLSLKQSNLAIALQSGSQAARSVADLILMNDSFSVLPAALREGQRILTGMQDILKLFLTRILYSALLILSTGFAGSFPLTPKNNSLLTLFTVGIPTIALAVWARPENISKEKLLRRMLHFILPAGLILSLAGLAIFLGYLLAPPLFAGSASAALTVNSANDLDTSRASLALAQTALTTFSVFCGLLLLVFVEPPSPAWVGGDLLSRDRRPAILAFVLLLAYILLMALPPLRTFLEMAPLSPLDYMIIGVSTILYGIVLRWIWRSHIFERFLGIQVEP